MSANEVFYENKATNTVTKIKMSVQTILLRLTVLAGMVAAVLTVLYFTPMPEQNFLSCERRCHDLDWPMICRIKLTIEMYQTMTNVCNCVGTHHINCTLHPNCILGSGSSRPVITANRQLPGPGIHVCQNDILVIDVVNKIPGQSLTIHWRGQTQEETPFMDGVPMVSQCPISSYTTFQYKFRAAQPGTHLWEGFSGMNGENGLFGSLVVRQPDKSNPHRHLYDFDNNEQIILLSSWTEQLEIRHIYQATEEDFNSILINGRSSETYETNLIPGKRYRFRVAYASGSHTCALKVSIERHLLKLISIDGHSVLPTDLESITMSRGERVDFVLLANNTVGSYTITVEPVNCGDNKLVTTGLIHYVGKNKIIDNTKAKASVVKSAIVLNNFCENVREGVECVDSIKSYEKIPIVLRDQIVQTKLFLSLQARVNFRNENQIGLMELNNFTFMFPSSPMLSQWNDITVNTCNAHAMPNYCQHPARISTNSQPCECTYVENIPLGNTVEIIISDQAGNLDQHIFHLHGYSFWVVGGRKFPGMMSSEEIQALENNDMLFNRNLVNPLRKDTITIPRYGVAALRFKADNPGYWMLRQEHSGQWTKGADVLLQVGEPKDFVPVPFEFPTCGDYVGPTFFLA